MLSRMSVILIPTRLFVSPILATDIQGSIPNECTVMCRHKFVAVNEIYDRLGGNALMNETATFQLGGLIGECHSTEMGPHCKFSFHLLRQSDRDE